MALFVIIQRFFANLACIPPVDDLNPFLSGQTVHIYLVGIPAAMSLLFRSAILEVELHLHLIYPLSTKQKYLTVTVLFYQLRHQVGQHG